MQAGLKAHADPVGVFSAGLFRGRTALVTGGGRGIGKQIAMAFARLGAQVTIASRNQENLEPTREAIEELGSQCLAVPTNIREPDQVDQLVAKTRERFGHIDFLINNAGGQFPARPTEISDGGWRAVVDLNLNGTWNLCSRVGPIMAERGCGSIVNIVHIYSLARGGPDFAHSGAARAGVVNLTQSLAFHWARFGVNVNALAPGTIETQGMREEEFGQAENAEYEEQQLRGIPAHRLGTADEMAALTLFLCSDAARYINGATLVADGALSMGSWPSMHDPEILKSTT